MKQNLITDVIQGMLPFLNNAQTERLQEVLQHTLFDYEVTKAEKDKELSEQNLVESFLSAKRIEGCSEKTLKYYNATIRAMLDGIGKGIKYIVTDDIRCYLTEYLYLMLFSIKPELDQKFFQGTGLKHLQKPLLKDRPIYIPEKMELEGFNRQVMPMFDIISENTRENQQLTSLRDWLLPMLMNGQATISD